MRCGERGGFAMAMVVLLLFAVGVGAATSYQIVRIEAELAIGREEASRALDVANAGLERYLAESLGPPDTVVYAIGGGWATLTPRRLVAVDDDTDLYVLRSEGTVSDARYPDSPARRVVSRFAYLHQDPVASDAAMLAAYDSIQIIANTSYPEFTKISGDDASTVSECARGNGASIIGVGNTSTSPPVPTNGAVVEGSPAHADLGSAAAVADSAAVRWDILQDPQQPVGVWDGIMPPFHLLPADSFPVVRMTGDYVAHFFLHGRGVLIVPGRFDINPLGAFYWDGIILAGSVGSLSGYSPSLISGMLVGGLDGGGSDTVTIYHTGIAFNRCDVIAANENLAYLEPLEATWWEGM